MLQLAEFHGNPEECGAEYGAAFEQAIMGFCKQEVSPSRQRLAYARACWRHVEKSAPSAAAFLRGMAVGARLTLEHVTLLALHEEIYHQPHCTAFAATGKATRGRQTIVAQNWDWSPALYPWPGLLRLHLAGHPRTLTYHYPGLWACAGVNENGLALMWTGGGYFPRIPPVAGVPTYAIIAEILLRGSVTEALKYLSKTRHAGCFIIFLGDAGGSTAVVEAIPGKAFVDRSGDVLRRSNHYLCRDVLACAGQTRPDRRKSTTLQRLDRMTELLDQHRGKLTPAVTQRILTDRQGPWPWLNQFPDEKDVQLAGMTIDSLFAVCETRTLYACRGGRTPGAWQTQTV